MVGLVAFHGLLLQGSFGSSAELPQYAHSGGNAGVGRFVPGEWGLIGCSIDNSTEQPWEVIAATYFEGEPSLQYGRKVWLPPHSRRFTYYPARAPQDLPSESNLAHIKSLLVDRSTGRETLIETRTGEMLHAGILQVFHQRDRTGVITDDNDNAVRDLVAAARTSHQMTVEVASLNGDPFPPSRETLASLDHLVISSDRLLSDAAGMRAVRQWLHDGGRLWLLLDQVSQQTVYALLGDRVRIQPVDEVDLSQFQLKDAVSTNPKDGPLREFAEPIKMVRLIAEDAEVAYTVDGWPAAIWLEAGKGRVLLTTVAPEGWYRERTADEPAPKQWQHRSNMVATPPLHQLAVEFLLPAEPATLPDEQAEEYVTSQIGYRIVPRWTVTLVLGGFCVLLVVAGTFLASSGQLERLSIVAPILAISAAGILAALGSASRRAVESTVVTFEMAEASPDVDDVLIHGVVAAYNQTEVDEEIGAQHGGYFYANVADQSSNTRRMLWTDFDRWRWENLALPSGVHVMPYTYATTASPRVSATATFGPKGLTGLCQVGPFTEPQDAIIATAAGLRKKQLSEGEENGRRIAVQLNSDGTLLSRTNDDLAKGEYLSSTVLDDHQRRRQEVYRRLLQSPQSPYPQKPTLLVWCRELDLGFRFDDQAERRGDALVAIPIVFRQTPPGTKVVIPAAFLPYHSVPFPGATGESASYDNIDQAWIGPLTAGSNTLLRFSVPQSVLPLDVEKAHVEIDIKAPRRKVTYSGLAGENVVTLVEESSPVGTFRYTIDRADVLQLDEAGGLFLGVNVGGIAGEAEESISSVGWQIEDIRMQIEGTTKQPVVTGENRQ